MNEETQKRLIEIVEYVGTELLKEQRMTRDAIVSLADAIAGRTHLAAVSPTPEPAAAPPAPAPVVVEAEAEPATQPEHAEVIDINRLRESVAEKNRAGHRDALKAIMAEFKAAKLPDLAEADYPAFLARVRAL